MSRTLTLLPTVAATLVASVFYAGVASAQLPEHLRNFPLASRRASGDAIAPMFNGWVDNGDGTVRLIYGFANKNSEQVLDVPLGPNNYIEPAEYDGVQPTHFPSYTRRGFVGIQERGIFAITVPADVAAKGVTWHLSANGYTYSAPGKSGSVAYQMSDIGGALGSTNPAIRFKQSGPESVTREGIYADRVMAKVGKPVTLSAQIEDRGPTRAKYYENKVMQYQLGSAWILHQGPAVPEFSQAEITGKERVEETGEQGSSGWSEVSTEATFSTPGDYVIRLRVDNFESDDSQFDNQCCWSNAYVPVTVTE